MREAHPWYVLMDVTSQGPPGSLHEPLAEALAAAQEAGLVRDALIAASGAQAARLWKMRESLAEAQISAGGSIAHDVSVPVSRIPEFIARADAAVAAAYPGIRPCAFGHVGDGNMHYNPVRPLDWDGAALQQRARRASTASCTTSWRSSAARSAPSTASAARGWPSSSTTRSRWSSP